MSLPDLEAWARWPRPAPSPPPNWVRPDRPCRRRYRGLETKHAERRIHRTSRRFALTKAGRILVVCAAQTLAERRKPTPRGQCRTAACAYPPQRRARGPERPGLFSAPPIWYSSRTARLRSVTRWPRQFPIPLRRLARTPLRFAPRARIFRRCWDRRQSFMARPRMPTTHSSRVFRLRCDPRTSSRRFGSGTLSTWFGGRSVFAV